MQCAPTSRGRSEYCENEAHPTGRAHRDAGDRGPRRPDRDVAGYSVTDYDHLNVLVEADIRDHESLPPEDAVGFIRVAGQSYLASFRYEGFNRRWDWGRGRYTVLIEPSGDGRYYDFGDDRKSSVPPSQFFECGKA